MPITQHLKCQQIIDQIKIIHRKNVWERIISYEQVDNLSLLWYNYFRILEIPKEVT